MQFTIARSRKGPGEANTARPLWAFHEATKVALARVARGFSLRAAQLCKS